MKDTVSDLQRHRREPQTTSADRIHYNLLCVAGEWGGFDEQWLVEMIAPFCGKRPRCRKPLLHRWMFKRHWNQIQPMLSADGGVMDGMHRVCRALMDEQKTIRAVRFAKDPEPDYIGIDADDLPYEAEPSTAAPPWADKPSP